ncbi:MAG: hypothetical protein JSU85_03360 [Candidatus Zixiibacteriota bacterium]|nr:MAG: hypothetical protein JSU85_03360 [candidate division Zixibacteria bacterium]
MKKEPIYIKDGDPLPKLTDREKIDKLTQKVYHCVNRKYSKGMVLDTLENIIIEYIEADGQFVCGRENITKKILAVHDVNSDNILTMLVGTYHQYRHICLETFCQKMSSLIFETGMKERIIEIMYAFILRSMKERFTKNKKYVFVGKEESREEGVIKPK